MSGPVIAVLNLKGGVGKTTLAAHVFREVWASKRISILLVDLDPQYNLSQQLLSRTSLPLRLKQGGLLCSCYVQVERVSCVGLEVAAGARDVRISHIHGSLSG